MIWALQSVSSPTSSGSDLIYTKHDQKGDMVFNNKMTSSCEFKSRRYLIVFSLVVIYFNMMMMI